MGIALLIVGNRFDQLVISDLDPRRDRDQDRHINVLSVNSQETMKHNPANVIRGADRFLEQNDWISSVQLFESAGLCGCVTLVASRAWLIVPGQSGAETTTWIARVSFRNFCKTHIETWLRQLLHTNLSGLF